ncbi:DNA-directed DNA polymerase [Halobaculum sp. MBLA0147]|uniref:DNA-directed DNA polymerase n=1 Tax=Halobaculum sp. MBLA0147 TaxID=3079934 RepID=UPI0035255A0C
MDQQTFDDLPTADDGDRPDAEAAVVAGEASTHVSEVVDAGDVRVPDRTDETPVELMVTAVDYTVEGRGSDQYPVVHVFGRTPDDELEHVRVVGVEPYFYVPTADVADRDLVSEYDVVLDTREHPGGDPDAERFESIRGEPVTKVTTRTPRDVGQIRDDFETTYEADILFPNRFLVDHDVTAGLRVERRRIDEDDPDSPLQVTAEHLEAADVDADLRINTFDIEVDDRNGFPENGEEPIVCLTSHDSYRDEYVLWLYDAPEGPGAAVPDAELEAAFEEYEFVSDDTTQDPSVRLERFDTEEAMLDAFLSYLNDTDPDLTTGWNFEDFDAPYLFDRMEELDPRSEYDLSPDRASRVDETWRSGWGGPDVKGRVVFDLLYAYQRNQFSELDSYRLDAVGELELGVGKERYTGDIGDLWEEDPRRLLEYNLRDVELCVEIDRQQNLIDLWDETRKFVGCQLEDAPTPGDVVDMYVLHQAYGEFVLPTKGQQAGEEFEGGAVFEPISGVAENVSVLDLKSLYPMCMVTINASPETIVDDPESFDGETYRAPNGTRFRKEPDGMMREMVDALLTKREEKKALRDEHEPGTEEYGKYDRQQASIKVIMNSLYGVSGWEQFRLYDKDNAGAITAMGRRVIEFTEEAAAEIGYDVTYGDTDSVMLSLSDVETSETTVPDEVREAHPEMSETELATTQAAIEASEDIETYINDRYDDFAAEELDAEEHRFEIEFEKLYRRFFQAGKKKRYAGHIVWKEGKHVDSIDITGFEYTRSDIAPITKRVQKRVIEMIVTGEDLDDVEEYLHEEIQSFKAGDVDLEEIGIPGGIGKKLDNYDTDTAQVRGAKYANLLLGTNFQSGSKPKRLYLDGVHPDFYDRVESELGLEPNGASRDDALYTEFKRDPDVICYEFADEIPEEFDVDYDKMLEKTLKGPIERITEALGLTWDEIESGQEQTGLGDWG